MQNFFSSCKFLLKFTIQKLFVKIFFCNQKITMGSSKIIASFNKNETKVTLCDWISKVRCKKREAKRRCHDLRVVAILSTALYRAEAEMRQKQQERAAKWAQLHFEVTMMNKKEEEKRRKEVQELWETDLSDLNNFIKDLSRIKTSVAR